MVRILPAAVLAVSPALLLAVGCAGDSAPLAPTALPEAALSGPAAASVSDAGSSASGSSIRSASSASVTGGPPTGVTAVAVAGHADRVLVSWTNDASNSAGVKHLVNYASGTCATADWSGAKAWPPTGGDAGRIPAADTSVTVTGLAAGSYCFTVGTYYGVHQAWWGDRASASVGVVVQAPYDLRVYRALANAQVRWKNRTATVKTLVNYGPAVVQDDQWSCPPTGNVRAFPSTGADDGRIAPGVTEVFLENVLEWKPYCFTVGAYRGTHDAVWAPWLVVGGNGWWPQP